jgi:glucokinase
VSGIVIGVDMGGSHVEFGLVGDGGLISAATLAVEKTSLQAAVSELETRIPALAAECGVKMSDVAGIGVGICAVVKGNASVLATNGKYDDGVGFNFMEWSERCFGLRCRAENDTRLALLGEHFAGAAKGHDDAVLVTLGTGIGGAVMIGGKLLRSAGDKAGSLAGHLGVDWNGRPCSCGNRGCAEAEASTAALDAVCREQADFAGSALANADRPVDFQMLFGAVDAGDTVARRVLGRCVDVWSALTVSLIHAYDPKVIVFGGGVMRRQEAVLPAVRRYVDRHAWAEPGSVSIVPSSLGSSAALLGAVPLLRGAL